MNNLPDCMHRGPEMYQGHFLCRTDRLVHEGSVSAETCLRCHVVNKPLRKSLGLGDTVHKVTHALGIDKLMPGCGGCKKRMDKLNAAVPYNPTDQQKE